MVEIKSDSSEDILYQSRQCQSDEIRQSNHHRLLRQKAAKYHIRTQKYTKLHALVKHLLINMCGGRCRRIHGSQY